MFDDVKPPKREAKSIPHVRNGTKPDDEIAKEETELEASTLELAEEKPAEKQSDKRRKLPKLLTAGKRHLTKKQWLIIAAVALILIGGGMVLAVAMRGDKKPAPPPTVAAQEKPAEPPKTTEPSRLTGVEVAIELNKRPVTGFMIENSPEARPQSGLKDAGIVVEAIAEGGITRFLALFQEAQPDYIGPIRSVRPYYLDFTLTFDASLAHVGGSADALAEIRILGVKDLDQFSNAASFTRVKNRYAPHNVYTSMASMDALNQKRGYTSSSFTSLPRKTETPSAQPNARGIDFNISSALYNVRYDYYAPGNSYKRAMGGKTHVDERSGEQLSPKVVVALIVPKGLAADRFHSTYNLVGSGKVFVFQDGMVTEGTWQKADRRQQFTFTDAAGKTIAFNPGQTWITLISEASRVAYKP